METLGSNRTLHAREGRLVLGPGGAELLAALGEAWGSATREVYVHCVVGDTPWFVEGEAGGMRDELISRGWAGREADSMLLEGQTKQAAALETARLQVESDAREIAELTAWLEDSTPRDKDGNRTRPTPEQFLSRHPLVRRRDILAAREARLRKKLEGGTVRVVFGGRKLARGMHDPAGHGFKDHEEWRGVWQRKRGGDFFVEGDAESPGGNASLRVTLSKGGDKLSLQVPEFLRHLSGRNGTVEFAIEGMPRAGLETALVAASPISARIRWRENLSEWHVIATFVPVGSPSVTGAAKARTVAPREAGKAVETYG